MLPENTPAPNCTIDHGPRTCAVCGVALQRRPGEKPYRFHSRKFCSRHCGRVAAWDSRGRVTFTKTCEACGATYSRRDEEEAGNFRKRKTCSRECGITLQAQLESATKNGRPMPHMRTGERQEYVCAVCGKHWIDLSHFGDRKKYCSRECANNGMISKFESACAVCGTRYVSHPSRPRTTCSRACGGIALVRNLRASGRMPERIDMQCAECGTEFSVPAGRRTTARYCSRRCTAIVSIKSGASQSPTTIEIETYLALTTLGIEFSPQERIGNFVVDAWLPGRNVAVECQGDYWHCNPRVFPTGPTNDVQTNGIRRDARKFAYLRGRGYRVIELWELDIHERGALALLREAL